MSKKHVKDWQRVMQGKGFYSGEIDGDFGPGTRRASFEAIGEPALAMIDLLDGVELRMSNQNAIRNKPITENLRQRLLSSVKAVYGPDCKIVVYSGGQDRHGHGSRRTGSVRHDDYGQGGRAADCYIYVGGKKIVGIELAKLGQYWLAKGLGGCGLEMATGGIHLDEWTTPPKGGGPFWTYDYSNGKPWGAEVRAMLVKGARGVMP